MEIVEGARGGLLSPARPEDRVELEAWLTLQASFALAPEAGHARLREAGGDPVRAARGLRPPEGGVESALRVLARARAGLLPSLAESFPEGLRALSDPPIALSLQGRTAFLAAPCVAIVGSRAATAHGRRFASRLAARLSAAGVTVVSGLARGIDRAAHEGALEGRAGTVAVQACGPEQIYPAEHRVLARRIAARGALLTEMPAGTPPRAPYFPLRNRLISGLSRALVVVEARRRSGSLVTARHALDQGREVLVVPGSVEVAAHEGSNALLRDGAVPVLAPEDVLAAVGVDAAAPAKGLATASLPVGAVPLAELLEREGALSRDELARGLGLAPPELALQLLGLELEGWLREERDGRLHWCGPSLQSGAEVALQDAPAQPEADAGRVSGKRAHSEPEPGRAPSAAEEPRS